MRADNHSSTPVNPLIFFLHIPKTGGTTIKSLLKSQYPAEHILELNPAASPEDKEKLKHSGLQFLDEFNFKRLSQNDIQRLHEFSSVPEHKLVTGHFSFGIHRHSKRPFRYISMVRKPETLILSLYHEMFRSDDEFDVNLVKSFRDFEEFASAIGNIQTLFLSGFETYRDLRNNPESALNTAMHNVENYFLFVGLFEKFSKSVRKIFSRLNLKKPEKTEHFKKGDYPPLLTGKLKQIISKNNILDNRLYEFIKKRF